MRDELIINGTKVDMGDSDVYLDYESNIMGDISKIKSSYSYTIKLPKTAHNMSVIKAVKPTSLTDFSYRKHSAMLLRDGIPIVRDADIILSSITDNDIQLSLSFGAGAGVKKLLADNNMRLTDLNVRSYDDAMLGRDLFYFSKTIKDIANYGFKEDDVNACYHPVVDAVAVLDIIEETYGVHFEGEKPLAYMPLLKREGLTSEAFDLTLTDIDYFMIDKSGNPLGWGGYIRGLKFSGDIPTDMVSSYGGRALQMDNINVKLKLSGDVYVDYSDPNNVYDQRIAVVVLGVKSSGYLEAQYEMVPIYPLEITEGGEYGKVAHFNFSGIETEYTNAEDTLVGFCVGPGTDDVKVSGYIRVQSSNKVNTVEYGEEVKGTGHLEGRYYTVPNLPDISVVDFIKGYTAVFGLFVTCEGNTIYFHKRDDLINAEAADWQSKRIGNLTQSFKLSDIARENLFKYKGGSIWDSAIHIDDDTLPVSTTIVELPFSPVQIGAYHNLYFPLYSYTDDGEQEFSADNNAYIVMLQGTTATDSHFLVVEGLRWSDLLPANYRLYRNIVERTRIVNGTYRLNPIELSRMDMTKPIYDDGAYYIISKVKTRANDICEVELIKIK